MIDMTEMKTVKVLKERGDTNSLVRVIKDEGLNELLVCKAIYGIDTPIFEAVFNREIRALSMLKSSEHIVDIYNYETRETKTGEKVGLIFMEFIRGTPLSHYDTKRIEISDKFNIINQLISAIELAHSHDIIHRDLNPSNIVLKEDYSISVIDFGTCKIKRMISEGTTAGFTTSFYSAPEIGMGSEYATEKSDLYSIGAIIYYLFTNKTPPPPIDFQDLIEKDDISFGMDSEVLLTIRKLVKFNPTDRISDIYELKSRISNLMIRFLNIRKRLSFHYSYEKYRQLQLRNLIPKNSTMINTSNSSLPQNFSELYGFYEKDEDLYYFLGLNYLMKCVYQHTNDLYEIVDFMYISVHDREKRRNYYLPILSIITFLDDNLHRKMVSRKNSNFEVSNELQNHYVQYTSEDNINKKYNKEFSVWTEVLEALKKGIKEEAKRIQVSHYKKDGNILKLTLGENEYLDEKILIPEQGFILERDDKSPIRLGTYYSDEFIDGRLLLSLKVESRLPNLRNNFELCTDYTRELSNIQKQLFALDSIKYDSYSCPFNLKGIISGVRQPITRKIKDTLSYFNKRLDPSQQLAVEKAINSESISIIQGPPGTGKTQVIVEIILQILKSNDLNKLLSQQKVLLVSQSHTAVDKMLEDLTKEKKDYSNIVRIGESDKVNRVIRDNCSIDALQSQWIKEIKNSAITYAKSLCEDNDIDYQEMVNHFIKNEKIPKDLSEVQKYVYSILEIQKNWLDRLEICVEMELYKIKSTNVIAGTCTGFLSNKIIRDVNFDYVIVDEAAKATFPELAVSLGKAKKIIMVGDHKQLPPIINADVINEHNFNKELLYKGIFEKLFQSFPDENKQSLETQYRMNPIIGNLISQIFYNSKIQNALITHKKTISTKDSSYNQICIEWISTSRIPPKQRYEKRIRDTFKNDSERKIIAKKLKELNSVLVENTDVAIITPYSAQKYSIQSMINSFNLPKLNIEVNTVDAFQGSQKKIVIYSTVRSNKRHGIGFLKSEERLNVSLSRAEALIIIVGDLDFLKYENRQNSKFPEIIDYIENTSGCKITEYCEES